MELSACSGVRVSGTPSMPALKLALTRRRVENSGDKVNRSLLRMEV